MKMTGLSLVVAVLTSCAGGGTIETRIDAIGDEESLAVTESRGDQHDHDPDSHCSTESVDCHPVGDCQSLADCQPFAVPVSGG